MKKWKEFIASLTPFERIVAGTILSTQLELEVLRTNREDFFKEKK